jgi:hypothetical protein
MRLENEKRGKQKCSARVNTAEHKNLRILATSTPLYLSCVHHLEMLSHVLAVKILFLSAQTSVDAT